MSYYCSLPESSSPITASMSSLALCAACLTGCVLLGDENLVVRQWYPCLQLPYQSYQLSHHH